MCSFEGPPCQGHRRTHPGRCCEAGYVYIVIIMMFYSLTWLSCQLASCDFLRLGTFSLRSHQTYSPITESRLCWILANRWPPFSRSESQVIFVRAGDPYGTALSSQPGRQTRRHSRHCGTRGTNVSIASHMSSSVCTDAALQRRSVFQVFILHVRESQG